MRFRRRRYNRIMSGRRRYGISLRHSRIRRRYRISRGGIRL